MFDPYLSEGDVIFAPPGYQRPTKYRESERRFDGNRRPRRRFLAGVRSTNSPSVSRRDYERSEDHSPIMALLTIENPLLGAPAVAPSTPAW